MIDEPCKSVEVIFARGSGSPPNSEELSRLREEMVTRLGDEGVIHNVYDLGLEEYGGHKYQAVQVSQAPYGNAIGAKVSSGYANDYGRSVDSGVGELYSYLTQRYGKCKSSNTKYVLGGYSQGAQVIGQTLPKLSAEIRNNIVFAAFFGDPKLHLPEGEGVWPDACRGKNLSAYRRVIASCHVDNGSLGARKPYLPEDMKAKSGLWCYSKDYVCGSSKNIFSTSGHSEYKNTGKAIDQAALEISQRLKKVLPTNTGSNIDTKPSSTASGTPDVVYIIDTTSSMMDRINQAKEFVRQAAAKIESLNGRVALVSYRDQGDAYTSRVESEFSHDLADFKQKLNSLTVEGGGDEPEAALHALMTAFNRLSWQDGAAKAAVIVTDEGFHNPDKVDGTTVEAVAKRSLEIDPVNVYPVVPRRLVSTYQNLADQTSGKVILDSGNTVAALTEALTVIQNRPVGVLKNATYIANPKQEITFDASDSYVADAEISKYEWDFDGNGAFERTTSSPIVNYTYTGQFDGTMQVRLTATNGTMANASAFVKIGTYQPPMTPQAPTNVNASIVSTVDGVSTVNLSWGLPVDNRAYRWIVSVNGTALGYVDADKTSIEITDIQRSEAVELSVVGMTDDGTLGDATTINVPAATTTPDTPAPSNPTSPTATNLLDMLMRCVTSLVTRLLFWR